MFVAEHQSLPIGADLALERLGAALAEQGIYDESVGAIDDGLDLFLKVGPGQTDALTKLVRARTLEPRTVGRTVVVPLRWEASGALGRLYPALDANIGIAPVNDTTSILSLVGSYTPPLGVVGSALDHAALSRIAQATIHSLLERLGQVISPQVGTKDRVAGGAVTRTP